jgi:hypothetical protein
MISIMASPIDILVLYIATKIIRIRRIKFPKPVLNKLTKSVGTKNKTNHKQINNVNNPTKKLILLREKASFNNVTISIYYNSKKLI